LSVRSLAIAILLLIPSGCTDSGDYGHHLEIPTGKVQEAGFVKPADAPKPPSITRVVPKEVVIASLYQQADGCQDTGRSVRIGIPNPELLDLSQVDSANGGISGISLRTTTKNHNSGWRNVAFDPASGVLALDLFAGGAGTKQCLPFVGCTCVGAEGGSIGAEVTAHYQPQKSLMLVVGQ
jgi:hypothetical protein